MSAGAGRPWIRLYTDHPINRQAQINLYLHYLCHNLVRELVKLALELTGGKPEVVYNPRTETGPARMRADLTLAHECLGYQPTVGLEHRHGGGGERFGVRSDAEEGIGVDPDQSLLCLHRGRGDLRGFGRLGFDLYRRRGLLDSPGAAGQDKNQEDENQTLVFHYTLSSHESRGPFTVR